MRLGQWEDLNWRSIKNMKELLEVMDRLYRRRKSGKKTKRILWKQLIKMKQSFSKVHRKQLRQRKILLLLVKLPYQRVWIITKTNLNHRKLIILRDQNMPIKNNQAQKNNNCKFIKIWISPLVTVKSKEQSIKSENGKQ